MAKYIIHQTNGSFRGEYDAESADAAFDALIAAECDAAEKYGSDESVEEIRAGLVADRAFYVVELISEYESRERELSSWD